MTSMFVCLFKRSGSILTWLGARCVTRTNAMPVSEGMWERNRSSASRPPAEAPTPTIGKPEGRLFLEETALEAVFFPRWFAFEGGFRDFVLLVRFTAM